MWALHPWIMTTGSAFSFGSPECEKERKMCSLRLQQEWSPWRSNIQTKTTKYEGSLEKSLLSVIRKVFNSSASLCTGESAQPTAFVKLRETQGQSQGAAQGPLDTGRTQGSQNRCGLSLGEVCPWILDLTASPTLSLFKPCKAFSKTNFSTPSWLQSMWVTLLSTVRAVKIESEI